MFKESLDDMCTSSSYYSSLSNNSADNLILALKKSSLHILIPSFIIIESGEKFHSKARDIHIECFKQFK